MASVYLDSCPNPSIDRPYGFPHLVEGSKKLQYALKADEGRPKFHVAGGVATVLYSYSPISSTFSWAWTVMVSVLSATRICSATRLTHPYMIYALNARMVSGGRHH